MSELTISNRQMDDMTSIPNLFIDEYLPSAGGEFVKVYLLLLRMSAGGPGRSVSGIADMLDLTEKDVMRALRYWEKKGLLSLEIQDGEVTGIILLKVRPGSSGTPGGKALEKPKEAPGTDLPKPKKETQTVKPVDLQELSNDQNFNMLLMLAGKYTGRQLGSRDLDILANLYQGVGMSAELLEYAIEYCVENDHRSMRYIETVALNWHEKGIRTVEEAKEEVVTGGKNTFAVLKAFGITGRNPAASERRMIDKWYRNYGFSADVVVEACDRTMRAIHQPSFEYADKILVEWKKLGIKGKDDIPRLDKKAADTEKNKQEKNKSEKKHEKASAANRFHNSSERNYDADELMKKISGIG